MQHGKQPLTLWERKVVVENKAHRGKLWKVLGSEQFLRGIWEYLTHKKGRSKKDSSGRCSRKTRSKARPVVTGVTLQRGCGTSQKKCGYRLRSPDNAPCLHRNEAWQLGEFLRKNTGRKEGSVIGPLKEFWEAYEKVAMDDIDRLGVAQAILRKSH